MSFRAAWTSFRVMSPQGQGKKFFDGLSPAFASQAHDMVLKRICFVCSNDMKLTAEICNFCGSDEWDDRPVKKSSVAPPYFKGFMKVLDTDSAPRVESSCCFRTAPAELDDHPLTRTGVWKRRYCTLTKDNDREKNVMTIFANALTQEANEIKYALRLASCESRMMPFGTFQKSEGFIFSLHRAPTEKGVRHPIYCEVSDVSLLESWLVKLTQLGVKFRGLDRSFAAFPDAVKEGWCKYAENTKDKQKHWAYFVLLPDKKLKYYAKRPTSPDDPHLGLLELNRAHANPDNDTVDHAFGVYLHGHLLGRKESEFYLRCRDKYDQHIWVKSLDGVIRGLPPDDVRGLEVDYVVEKINKARASEAPVALAAASSSSSSSAAVSATPPESAPVFSITVTEPSTTGSVSPPNNAAKRPPGLSLPGVKTPVNSVKMVSMPPVALKIGSSACLFLGCFQSPTLICPTCAEYKWPEFTACSQEHFSLAWASHDLAVHQPRLQEMMRQQLAQQQVQQPAQPPQPAQAPAQAAPGAALVAPGQPLATHTEEEEEESEEMQRARSRSRSHSHHQPAALQPQPQYEFQPQPQYASQASPYEFQPAPHLVDPLQQHWNPASQDMMYAGEVTGVTHYMEPHDTADHSILPLDPESLSI